MDAELLGQNPGNDPQQDGSRLGQVKPSNAYEDAKNRLGKEQQDHMDRKFLASKPSKLDEKKCFGCHKVKPVSEFSKHPNPTGYTPRCKICNNLYHAEYYQRNHADKDAKNTAWRKKNWDRVKELSYKRQNKFHFKANQAVNNAIRAGKFEKQPCEQCGDKGQFHHTDGYEKENWFVGVWLCPKHHAAQHRQARLDKLMRLRKNAL